MRRDDDYTLQSSREGEYAVLADSKVTYYPNIRLECLRRKMNAFISRNKYDYKAYISAAV
jgi:hypothetical protein